MIWIILVTGTIIRLVSINQSLWLDEAINVLAAYDYTFWDIVTKYAQADFHPPGFFAILWIWTKIFGYSEVAVRIPSVFFGVGTILLTYCIGTYLHSRKLGLIAAVLLTINPLHIYYSQEARMYSMATFAGALNTYYFFRLLRQEKSSTVHYFGSLVLLFLSDYVAYLLLPAQVIILTLQKKKEVWLSWLKAILSALLLWMIWLPVFASQLNIGTQAASDVPGWKAVVGSFGIKPVALTFVKFIIGRISLANKQLYLLMMLPIAALYLFLFSRFITLKKHKMNSRSSSSFLKKIDLNYNARDLFILMLIPLVLAWLISAMLPIYSYFRLLFLLPPFVLLVSLSLVNLSSRLFLSSFLIVFLVNILFTAIYLLNPYYHREDWKSATAFVNSEDPIPVLFESTGAFAPFKYYNRIDSGIGALKSIPARKNDDVKNLEELIKDKQKVFLFDYLVEITDPNRQAASKLTKIGYKQERIYNFNGVGFIYEFVKK